ncbi:hypothetical protein HUW51_08195 [Adhaeribacter swui]|uniref:Uncharacterized protein n=1 Tax=Adhaeribacter swui TaxID=2086471 RepID=A0A7G7G6C7_9BACT|nr:hypothetical protein [Adhaeribacter swui]QNF32711.1 hypothetical protein HUW51_08195 [Adhaeribacter swui]
MKNIISSSARWVNAIFALFLAVLVSSCSQEPQRLLFSNHPTEFKRVENATAKVATPEIAPVTANAAEAPTAILSPEQAKQEELTAEIRRNEAVKTALEKTTVAPTQKATFREKVTALKAVKKEIKTAKKEIKKIKEGKKVAEGPVTNDVAIKVIILGLIVALLGLIVPVLGGLGGLIVIVGLVLLLLNYL